ncbi:MAG: phosphoribosyltransferase, partial [Candidatus Bathyarchaeia archaeon]
NADVPGLRALVVDDVSDTGESLKVARRHVLSRGASEVRVATLHVKPWSRFRPDFYAEEVDAWIVYPWEPRETLLSMAERLEEDGLEPAEVRRRLAEMGFSPSLIDGLL